LFMELLSFMALFSVMTLFPAWSLGCRHSTRD